MRFFSLAGLIASGAALASSATQTTSGMVSCTDDAQEILVGVFFRGLENLNRWGASDTDRLLDRHPKLANATYNGRGTIQATLSNVSMSEGLSIPEHKMLDRLLTLKAPVDIVAAVDLTLHLIDKTFVTKAITANKDDAKLLGLGLVRAVELAEVDVVNLFLRNYATRYEMPFTLMNPNAPKSQQESVLDYALRKEKTSGIAELKACYSMIAKSLQEGQVKAFSDHASVGSYCTYSGPKPSL